MRLFFFLCGYPHRKMIFNLSQSNFSVHVRPTEKLFLTANRQKNSIFLTFYFCVLFSGGTPSEKYFSVGIRIFLWVFTRIGVFEFPVVQGAGSKRREDPFRLFWLPSPRLTCMHITLLPTEGHATSCMHAGRSTLRWSRSRICY